MVPKLCQATEEAKSKDFNARGKRKIFAAKLIFQAHFYFFQSLYDRFCAVADKEEPLAASIAAFSELPMLFCPREKLKCLERWVDAANAAQELKLEVSDVSSFLFPLD